MAVDELPDRPDAAAEAIEWRGRLRAEPRLLTKMASRGFLVEEHMSMAAAAPSPIAGPPSARGMALTSELDDLFREHHQLIYRTAYSVTGSQANAWRRPNRASAIGWAA